MAILDARTCRDCFIMSIFNFFEGTRECPSPYEGMKGDDVVMAIFIYN